MASAALSEPVIYGSAYDATTSTGDWAFMAPGTGYHMVGRHGSIKVLYGYRVEVLSIPDEDNYEPTIQHAGEDDTINSDFDEETCALRPNEGDMVQPSGLVTEDG
ncbi:hypothetical protein PZH32_11700, partial [Adlercreutzia equolifaciens]|uniref:hypothetical protein n=1 Tax=Adlercreutzia equolifaciens TaxID=446660 RepID=UPI0023B1D6AB